MTHRKNSVALGPSPRGTLAWGSGSPIPFGGTMSADFTGSKACREEWFSCRVLGGLPDVDVIGPVALGPRSSSDRAGRDASRRCRFEALVPTDRNRGAQTIPRVASRPPRRNGVENGEARGPPFRRSNAVRFMRPRRRRSIAARARESSQASANVAFHHLNTRFACRARRSMSERVKAPTDSHPRTSLSYPGGRNRKLRDRWNVHLSNGMSSPWARKRRPRKWSNERLSK